MGSRLFTPAPFDHLAVAIVRKHQCQLMAIAKQPNDETLTGVVALRWLGTQVREHGHFIQDFRASDVHGNCLRRP